MTEDRVKELKAVLGDDRQEEYVIGSQRQWAVIASQRYPFGVARVACILLIVCQ